MSNFEITIVNKVRDKITPFLDKILAFITRFGEQTVLILLILMVYFAFSKKGGELIAFSIFSSILLNNTIKSLFRRERPFNHPKNTFKASRVETAVGFAFPSGHSQNAAAAYTSLALIYDKTWLWIVAIILIALVAFSRIGLGVHYPTDVVFGVAFGVVIAILSKMFVDSLDNDLIQKILLTGLISIFIIPLTYIIMRRSHLEIYYYDNVPSEEAIFLGYLGIISLEQSTTVDQRIVKTKAIEIIIALLIMAALIFGVRELVQMIRI